MKEKVKIALKFVQYMIEEVWLVLVIVWNLPVGLIELGWTFCFNKEKFNYNWNLLKSFAKNKGTMRFFNDQGIY